MPLDPRIPLGVTPPDPNGFTNALAAGMKMRQFQDQGDRLAAKDQAATAKSNALSAYGRSPRGREDLSALWAASPEAAAGIEKTTATAGLTAEKTKKAKADWAKANFGLLRDAAGAILANPTRENATTVLDNLEAQGGDMTVARNQLKTSPDQQITNLAKGWGMNAQQIEQLTINERNVNSQIEDRGARTGIAQGNADETARHHGAMEKKTSNGLSITGYDEQGRPLIQMGGSSAPFSKPTQGKLEETQVQGMEGLARLDDIMRVAKPQLLTYQNQAKDLGLDVVSKLGMTLSPENQKFRNDYTDMRQSTMVNLNKTIKDQTGATVTAGEVPRIAATVPTMDDAPDQYMRKLENSQRLLRNGVIRAQINRDAGMDPLNTTIDLGETKTLINKREEQLKRHYAARAPGMKPAEVDAAIEKQVRQEFGY